MKSIRVTRMGIQGILLLISFLAISTTVVGQQVQVPQSVRARFSASLPGVSATWIAGLGTNYEAHFVKNGQKMAYIYSSSGQLQFKMLAQDPTSLPANLASSLDRRFSAYDVTGFYKVISRSKKRFYEVRLETPGNMNYVRYTASGALIGHKKVALPDMPDPALTAKNTTTPATTAEKTDNGTPKETVPNPATDTGSGNATASKTNTTPANTQPSNTTTASSQANPASTETNPATTNSGTSTGVAMRGEASTTTTTTTDISEDDIFSDDNLTDDLDDLFDEDDDLDDLFNEDGDDDFDLEGELDDDDDLFDDDDDIDWN